MTHEYELTSEDYIWYNLHLVQNSKMYRRNRLVIMIAGPIGALIALIQILARDVLDTLAAVAIFTVLSGVWIAFAAKYSDWSVRNRIQALMREAGAKGFVGSHQVTLTPRGIHSESEGVSSDWRSDQIERIEDTPNYVLLHRGSWSAFIIPRRSFPEDKSFVGFVDGVRTLRGRVAGLPISD